MKIQNTIDQYQIDKVELGEECGLTFTGEYKGGEPEFIGDNKAWAHYNDGGI